MYYSRILVLVWTSCFTLNSIFYFGQNSCFTVNTMLFTFGSMFLFDSMLYFRLLPGLKLCKKSVLCANSTFQGHKLHELLGTHRIGIRILNSVQYALLKLFVNMY